MTGKHYSTEKLDIAHIVSDIRSEIPGEDVLGLA